MEPKKPAKPKKDSKKKPTFEQAIDRLEQIVAQLEGGESPLHESLRLFKEGAELAAFCDGELKNAELTVKEIAGEEGGAAPGGSDKAGGSSPDAGGPGADGGC